MTRGAERHRPARIQADSASPAEQEVARIRTRLKILIHLRGQSQRQIERQAGFSKGYLSQLMCGNIDLKYRHLLAVLAALDTPLHEFFADLYPLRPGRLLGALAHFRSRSNAIDREVRDQIARLYGIGLASLADLSERLDRCEDALDELEALGLLSDSDRSG